MFCKNCGQNLPDGAVFCPNCNAPVADAAQPQTPPTAANPYAVPPQQPPYGYGAQPPYGAQQPYGYAPQQPIVQPPKPSLAWLIVNIVCLVLSGNIFSIIGTIFGVLAQSAYNKGAYAEAESKNKTTKILGIISIVTFVLFYILVFYFVIFLGTATLGSAYYY